MSKQIRRPSSAPCYVCANKIGDEEDIIYCPECGEQYHKQCWVKNGSKCIVYDCKGASYNFWRKVEPKILSILNVKTSKLLSNCPNCHNGISPLDRYCQTCGYDINRPERQKTFWAYDFTKKIQKFRRIVYTLALLTGAFFIYSSGLFLHGVFGNISYEIIKVLNERATMNAPTPTFTPRPITATIRPTSTFISTPTLISTLTSLPPTPKPTKTPTLRPTKTPTPKPIKTSTKSCSGVTITVEKTSKGNILHVNPCSGGGYDMGPLANGAYAIGPNEKFLVYVSGSDGKVYAARVGDKSFIEIANLKRDYQFGAFRRNETPSFELSFTGGSAYYLRIYETKFAQSATIQIPLKISQ